MAEPLQVAIGRTKRTEALFAGAIADPALPLDLPAIAPISRAFAPMVREGRYPVSEMAIATFLMAKHAGVDMVLLPCVLAARFQESALLCRADGPIAGPADLRGKRIGVRAYSQTTGMWLRGILQESFGIPAEAMRWVTFEDAHLAAYRDPPWAERAPAGAKLEGMLKAGEIDAAIFGNDMPDDPAFRPVFADAAAAGEAFRARHGFVPVNHLLVARRDIARDRAADLVTLVALLQRAGAEAPGRAAL
uniref:ABC transporter substrate-binding protein n=1 Tax=Falsiroseomonas oryzae TaxID=2766473 RepID=UPI0022EB3967